MKNQFDRIIDRINSTLHSSPPDCELAARLFSEAVETAANEKMILSSEGNAVSLRPKTGRHVDIGAKSVLEIGITLAQLIEDQGHKTNRLAGIQKIQRGALVESAEKHTRALVRYGELTLSSHELYPILKSQLMIHVMGGAFFGAQILAESARELCAKIRNSENEQGYLLEEISMIGNSASIQIHLNQQEQAALLYKKALSLIRPTDPAEITQAIRQNLEGIPQNYDPDFFFLPE